MQQYENARLTVARQYTDGLNAQQNAYGAANRFLHSTGFVTGCESTVSGTVCHTTKQQYNKVTDLPLY